MSICICLSSLVVVLQGDQEAAKFYSELLEDFGGTFLPILLL